jgi:lipid A 4'-phosphatase
MPSNRAILWLLLCTALVFGLFAAMPQIDLAVTAAFYTPGDGFTLEHSMFLNVMRRAIWGASILLVLLALVGWGVAMLKRRPVFGLSARRLGFVLLLYVLGPGLLVEWGLKGHWGRARPADVTQFGGAAQFTPVQVISDQCETNCSFVGGESGGAATLAICLLLILATLRPSLPHRLVSVGQGVALCLPVLAGLQRLVTGRHFLSDVVLSVLLIALLAAVLAQLMRLSPCPSDGQTG